MIVTAVAAALTIPASLVMTRAWGLVGLCVAIFLGRLVQSIAYPLLVARCLERAQSFPLDRIARPGAVTALLFAAATLLGERVLAQHWMPWAGGVVLTFGITLGVTLFAGLPAPVRRAVLTRYKTMGRTFLSR